MDLKSVVFLVVLMAYGGSSNVAPKITNLPTTLDFPENTTVGSIIFTCTANDTDDQSTSDGTVSYNFMSGNEARKFSMDAATCTIYLALNLDYETTRSYTLNVQATDGGGGIDQEKLTINVRDVNDNAPSCNPSLTWGTLSESATPGTAFAKLTCTDPDTGPGGTIEYAVLLGNSSTSRSDTIAVGRTNGSAYILRSIDFDKEPDTFSVLVQVTDQGSPKLSSTATVILSLTDVDDNAPQFTAAPYQANVDENVPLGYIVLNITATDADKPNTTASLVTYESSCSPDWLMIDRYSGALITDKDIDYEINRLITCQVFAFSDPKSKSTATVTVTVNDINDGVPTFQQSFYSVSVNENTNVGTTIIVVTATDPEKNVPDYSTDSTAILISPTGAVTIAVSPDYEKDTSFLVTLTANDKGNPPLTSTALLQVSINPVNEYPPVFVRGCSGSVSEDSVPGTSVLTVTASDDDAGLDGAVSYILQTQNTPFYLDASSGFIGVASHLDYETTSSYTFIIRATDNSTTSKRSATQTCTISIIDVNDQAVECQPPDITVVQYPFPIGQAVAAVNCSVSNKKPPQLQYNIADGNDLDNFQIDSSTGIVTLKSIPLSQNYTLNIAVTFGADTTHTKLIVFAEQELKLLNLPATLNITEGQPAGLIFAVNACCAFPKVEYQLLSGNDDKRITLTSSNGQIRLMVPYDRELQDIYLYQIQTLSDSGQTATSALTVNVLDVNDNAPEFSSGVYEISVDENLAPSHFIQRYTATDKDIGNNSTLTYSITSGNNGDVFSINNTGHLVLEKALNYEVMNRYELVIWAVDQGSPPQTGTTLVVVNVQDNNQYPPQLVPVGGAYSANLSEDSALGTTVFQLQATDNDARSRFVYGIVSGNTNNDFQIDPINGTIIIVRFLDREHTPSYLMNLSATNQNGISVFGTLNITITDVNDNNPVFSTGVYVFYVPDQTASGQTLGPLNVTDADLGANATISLSITGGNTGGAFMVSGLGLQTTIQMNYPNVNMYRLTVQASDAGTPMRTSSATVIVNVLNGNIPYFNVSSASIRIREDLYVGAKVFDANATGKGAVENGSITYSLTPGNSDFSIVPSSGEVKVLNALDYEKKRVYDLMISASNMASPSSTATFSLTVNIDNVNEEDPYFVQHSFSFKVDEGTKPNFVVGTVLATDPDGVTETMTGSPDFEIDYQTGEIKVKGALDYLVRQYYNYIVVAKDMGTPPRSAMASVVILIADINNHAPVFTSASVVQVLDSTPVGSDIFQIHATDLDTGDGGNVSYEIVNPPGQTTFTLNRRTGILQTGEKLDYLTTPTYTLTIRAYDAGIPSRDNTTTLTVNVIPTNPNNYDPVFSGSCPTSVSLPRNSSTGQNVLACSATDRDTGISGTVQYRIISGNEDGYFFIDYKSGSVTTATELLTAKNSYNVVVFASDKGNPPRNTSLSFTVDVVPALIKNITSNYNFTCPEDTPVNDQVGLIIIDDGRTVSKYSISIGNYGNAFDISLVGNNGNLFVKSPLDRELYPLYSLTVQATTDVDDSTIIVAVNVTDVNDNDPEFALSTLNLAVPENSPAGTTLTTISYTDLDTDAVNRNNALSVSGSSLFAIDQSGHLTLASVPDFETDGPSVTFNVLVSDKQPPFHTSTLTVTVSIIDVDETEKISPSAVTDSALISLEVPYQASVGHLVYTLKPGDFGLIPGPAAVIQYVAYQTTSPFRIQQSTGDITVSGSLTSQTKYYVWAMIQVTEAGQTSSNMSLIRIDTFDRNTQMIVIEFSASYSYVLDRIQQFRSRAQNFFTKSQRIGFCNLIDTSTGARRRLLALKAAAYTYVVGNTTADEMSNINEPKSFLTEEQILAVLQKSLDGTPVTGLSDPSVVDVQTVEPYEDSSSTSSDDFEDFINSPAGIAVFCLLGLLIVVIIILIVTCIVYRKYSKKRQRPKKGKKKETAGRGSFSKMSESPSYFNSNPQIIVSAPPPVTLQTPPIEKPSSPPSKPQETFQDYEEPRKQNITVVPSQLPSQYGVRDGGKNPPSKKNKSIFGKNKLTKPGKKTPKSSRKT